MNKTIKTAISLPRETYQRVESIRRKTGKSRSELYAAALQVYLKAQEVRELEKRYSSGYQTSPENLEEISALAQASASLFAEKEDW